jgi:hypothetical protein
MKRRAHDDEQSSIGPKTARICRRLIIQDPDANEICERLIIGVGRGLEMCVTLHEGQRSPVS